MSTSYITNLETNKPMQIFESKGEMGIFCNTKKHITIPQEFHFATDERISKPNSVLDAFDKVYFSTNRTGLNNASGILHV